MFEKELKEAQQNIDATGDDVAGRRRALEAAIILAGDLYYRISEYILSRIEKFRRRKSEFGRPVRADEKPNELNDQTRKGRRYRGGGQVSIAIEVVLAAVTAAALVFEKWESVFTSTAVGLGVGILTWAFAFVVERGLHVLADKIGDPPRTLQILTRYVALPSFLTMLFAGTLFVAARLLPGSSLLAISPLLSAAPFIAAASFIIFGSSLKVIGDILMWSVDDSREYQALLSERVLILNAYHAWTDELRRLDGPNNNGVAGTLPPATPALPVPPPPIPAAVFGTITPSELMSLPSAARMPVQTTTITTVADTAADPNGSPGLPANGRGAGPTGTLAAILIAIAALGLSGCVEPSQVTAVPVEQSATVQLLADASGVKNEPAYRAGGENLKRDLPDIVLEHKAAVVNVGWFGPNGWAPEPKKRIEMPKIMDAEVKKTDMGEAGIIPSVEAARKEQDEKAKVAASATMQDRNRIAVAQALNDVTVETLIPSPSINSACTDLDGVFGQIDEAPADHLMIWIILTDGRQNCRGRGQLQPLLNPKKNKAVVVMIIPGDPAAGREDFTIRKKMVLDACPWAVVISPDNPAIASAVSKAVAAAAATN
ncbi:MAG: hypothetical protein JNL64_00200 [Blastocatellia bacterium]|nr:hypothetical protein [Blastocatellia bacterium]